MKTDPGAAEIQRIRLEYERRDREIPRLFYGWNHPANLFSQSQTVRAAIEALDAEDLFPLDGKSVADIGCGRATWLLEFAQWGASADQLCGIDLDEARIAEAKRKLPGADLVTGDARQLPWPDAHFDIVSQVTLFTSILSPFIKTAIAKEMLRILKPDGAILWYDFRINNPKNPNVRGVSHHEICELFPGCTVKTKPVTLAPPIARMIVPHCWILGLMLEKLPLLCTHYVAVIRRAKG